MNYQVLKTGKNILAVNFMLMAMFTVGLFLAATSQRERAVDIMVKYKPQFEWSLVESTFMTATLSYHAQIAIIFANAALVWFCGAVGFTVLLWKLKAHRTAVFCSVILALMTCFSAGPKHLGNAYIAMFMDSEPQDRKVYNEFTSAYDLVRESGSWSFFRFPDDQWPVGHKEDVTNKLNEITYFFYGARYGLIAGAVALLISFFLFFANAIQAINFVADPNSEKEKTK